MNTNPSKIVFFFGAGASVAAGVPDTYSFVTKYLESFDKTTQKKKTIEKIIEILERWKDQKIDIELLLETLTKLDNKEEDPLQQFYLHGEYILDAYEDKNPLINDLKDFIKSKAIVSEAQYLQPLLPLVEEFHPLDIISVNYDTLIEHFCSTNRLDYQDGFDDHWNPKTFEKDNIDIRLYKIHGSVLWYQTDRGDYVKLLVKSEESHVQLMTGEKAENLMLYPMQKFDYAEPFLELSVIIKRLIESEKCEFLVVVGYSFRDEHIKRILWDAVRKNRDLRVILIDPKAYQIYSKNLKYYDENKSNPSSLNGKVICLPYLFEKVFPKIKNLYIKKLIEGRNFEASQHQLEILDEPAIWISSVKQYIDAEYFEKSEELLKREPLDSEKYPRECLEFTLKISVNLAAGNEMENANKYFEMFCKHLTESTYNRINAHIFGGPGSTQNVINSYTIELDFAYFQNGSSFNRITGLEFIQIINSLSEFCETRRKFVQNENTLLQKISQKLIKIKKYLEPFKEGKIGFDDYFYLRHDKILDGEIFKNNLNNTKKDGLPPERLHYFIGTFIDIERRILKEIIEC